MLRQSLPLSGSRRQGFVLMMVISILALLFIIGASLLTVARFERQSAEQRQTARQIRAVTKAMENSILHQLRNDIVGTDGVPYTK